MKRHARKTLFTYKTIIDIQYIRFFCSENTADNKKPSTQTKEAYVK